MTGKTHAMVGLASGLLVSNALEINPVVSAGMCCLGGLILDIDAPTSTINKLIPGSVKTKNVIKIILGGFMIFQKYYVSPVVRYIGIILLLSAICATVEYRFSLWKGLEKRIHHRTLFHDPRIGLVLCTLPLFMLNASKEIILAYTLGLITHYLLDWCTVYGLPIYGSKRRFIRSPIHCKSNNFFVEALLIVMSFGLIMVKLGVIL